MPVNGWNLGLVWSERLAGWVLAYTRRDSSSGGSEPAIVAVLFDDHARLVDGPLEIGSGQYPVPVAMRSRVGVAWGGAGGIRFRSFPWPDAAAGSAVLELPMPIGSDALVHVEGYHDFALVSAMDGSRAQVCTVDALAGTIAHDPVIVGRIGGWPEYGPQLEAVTERGYLGLCYATCGTPGPDGGDDGFSFRVIRPDGMPVGTEVEVASGLLGALGCDVGWSGTEFVVVYWSTGLDAASSTIFAQRVRPLL
jgi:hypothetical protein